MYMKGLKQAEINRILLRAHGSKIRNHVPKRNEHPHMRAHQFRQLNTHMVFKLRKDHMRLKIARGSK